MTAGRWLAAGVALALALAGLGCPPARVVPSGSHDLEPAERRVLGRVPGVTLVVTGRPWSAPPQELLMLHTPLWVEVANTSDRRFKLSPEDFSLVTRDGREIGAISLAEAVSALTESPFESRVLQSEGFKASVLAPGGQAHGYVVFHKKFGSDAAGRSLTLRLVVRDESSSEELGTVEAPLSLVQ